jgi:hypothetical protein
MDVKNLEEIDLQKNFISSIHFMGKLSLSKLKSVKLSIDKVSK